MNNHVQAEDQNLPTSKGLVEACEQRDARLRALLTPQSHSELTKRIQHAQLLSVFCLELYGKFLAQYEKSESSRLETHEAKIEAWVRSGEEVDQRIADLESEVDKDRDAAQVRAAMLKLQAEQHAVLGELLSSDYAQSRTIARTLVLQLHTALKELYGSDKPARDREILLAVAKALLGLLPGLDHLLSVWELSRALHVREEQASGASELLSELDSYATALTSWGILHQLFMTLLESDFMVEFSDPTRDQKPLVEGASQTLVEKFKRFCEEFEHPDDESAGDGGA